MTSEHRNKDAVYIEPGSPSEKGYCESFNSPKPGNRLHLSKKNLLLLDRLLPGIWHHAAPNGWLKSLEEFRTGHDDHYPALIRVPKLIILVPGIRKAKIVRRTLDEPISAHCLATILRNHLDATVYLDEESAADLKDLVEST